MSHGSVERVRSGKILRAQHLTGASGTLAACLRRAQCSPMFLQARAIRDQRSKETPTGIVKREIDRRGKERVNITSSLAEGSCVKPAIFARLAKGNQVLWFGQVREETPLFTPNLERYRYAGPRSFAEFVQSI